MTTSMTTSRVTATAANKVSAPNEPTVVIERQAAPSARPTLSRRERFHSSGDLFEITEAEGLDHVCLDRRDVLVGLVGTKRCANDGARSAAMGTISEAKDIAEAVVYLTEARHVTGEVLHVEGGARAGRW